jgi:hypothetical protein
LAGGGSNREKRLKVHGHTPAEARYRAVEAAVGMLTD